MKKETYITATDNTKPFYITSNGGKCIGGHTWTYSGGDYVLEGTLCDCGIKGYKSPKYCTECGNQLLT